MSQEFDSMIRLARGVAGGKMAKESMRSGKWMGAMLIALVIGQLLGCAASMDAQYDLDAAAAEEEAPLGGEALAQRRMDLGRAWRDLLHFDVTMQSLVDRKDSRSIAQLDDFLAQYMAEHLDPMLRPVWQSSHPELMALDANLRFMKAQILTDMRYTRKVQESIDDIEIRFMGRENMLVEYPVGEQRSLGEALELLRDSKWNG
jgi:hypothetical protein